MLVSIYKGEGRILVIPVIDDENGHIEADWFVRIPEMKKEYENLA